VISAIRGSEQCRGAAAAAYTPQPDPGAALSMQASSPDRSPLSPGRRSLSSPPAHSCCTTASRSGRPGLLLGPQSSSSWARMLVSCSRGPSAVRLTSTNCTRDRPARSTRTWSLVHHEHVFPSTVTAECRSLRLLGEVLHRELLPTRRVGPVYSAMTSGPSARAKLRPSWKWSRSAVADIEPHPARRS